MNSVLQQLYMQPAVRACVLGVDGIPAEEQSESVLYQFQRMLAHLQHGHMQYHVPREFWKTYKHWGQPVNVREQHDALEFFNSLIDQVDEAMHKAGQPKVMAQVFGGVFADQKVIKVCMCEG